MMLYCSYGSLLSCKHANPPLFCPFPLSALSAKVSAAHPHFCPTTLGHPPPRPPTHIPPRGAGHGGRPWRRPTGAQEAHCRQSKLDEQRCASPRRRDALPDGARAAHPAARHVPRGTARHLCALSIIDSVRFLWARRPPLNPPLGPSQNGPTNVHMARVERDARLAPIAHAMRVMTGRKSSASMRLRSPLVSSR